MKVVSVLAVERPEIWSELDAAGDLAPRVVATLDERRRVVDATFERDVLPALRQRGLPVLVRFARRTAADLEAAREDLRARVDQQPVAARDVLLRAQRHAHDGLIRGSRVWDPEEDSRHVRSLLGAGLLEPLPSDEAPLWGPYRLHPDLEPPPPLPYDFSDAVMDLTDDLSTPAASLSELLHDLAALTAAMTHHAPRRTHAGTIDKASAKKLGHRLADRSLAASGELADHPRWARALRTLEALGAVTMDPVRRDLGLEPGLEEALSGTLAEAMDRLFHRLVDPDVQAAVPALRAALAQAGGGAIDELIFVEALGEQHRDVIFAPWHREGRRVYPVVPGEPLLPFSPEAFAVIEGRMVHALLSLAARIGLIRRAPGVFAATDDGQVWAGRARPMPPVWITSDLGLTVPPNGVTPWERFQLERLGRCVQRDVVDVYTLERAGLDAWLATHDVDEALALLARRCPAVPPTVVDTVRAWARTATRITLTRGVLLP